MFGLFKKTKNTPVTPTPPAQPASGAQLQKVIVRQSAYDKSQTESWYLVGAVVDFVNDMNNLGFYKAEELPEVAAQCYNADLYLAQVNNGGHSQFINNCRNYYETTTVHALAGLRAMGAMAHLLTLEQMTDWVEKNPDEAQTQTGFDGGRSAFLDTLDTGFFAANNAAPMADLNAAWIRTWPMLQVVADSAYDGVIREIALQNPKREARLEARAIGSIEGQFTNPLLVATALALVKCPRSTLMTQLGAGVYKDVDGQSKMVFEVGTVHGPAYVVPDEAGVTIYERVMPEGEPMPGWEDREKFSQALKDGTSGRFQTPYVGEKLASATFAEAADLAKISGQTSAPVAIFDLLSKAFGDVKIDAMGPRPNKGPDETQDMVWMIAANGGIRGAFFTTEGAVLVEWDNDQTPIATAPMQDIKARMENLMDAL